MPTVCLSGIVRNESRIIQRCLDCAKFAIDYICLTDTGSTDNTIELIKKWGKQNNIPTVVCTDKWKNFEYNRTQAIRNSVKSFPNADYLLLIDADMQLEDHGFDRNDLHHDAYQVEQYTGTISYSNVRLIATRIDWFYEGVTHEYVTSRTQHHFEPYRKLRINDIGDGGCKDNKFKRDEELLKTALAKMKKGDHLYDRYNFYLARTYEDTKQYNKAIRHYRIRAELEGFQSEKWFAQYKIGVCLLSLDRYEEALVELMKAYRMNPKRVEPLVDLVNYLVFKKEPDYWTAGLFLDRMQALREQPPDANLELFVNMYYHHYYIDYLTTIIAYYVGKKELGLEACLRLVNNPQTPINLKLASQSNLKFYQHREIHD